MGKQSETEQERSFASAKYTAGQLNAIIKGMKRQCGDDAPERFMKGELRLAPGEGGDLEPIARAERSKGGSKRAERSASGKRIREGKFWREEDGTILFSVTSDGTTGEGWIERLHAKGFQVDEVAAELLRSRDFIVTRGITYRVAILRPGVKAGSVNIAVIPTFPEPSGFDGRMSGPPFVVACLIRDQFSEEDLHDLMLSRIKVMHHPVDKRVLTVERGGIDRAVGGLGVSFADTKPTNLACGWAHILR